MIYSTHAYILTAALQDPARTVPGPIRPATASVLAAIFVLHLAPPAGANAWYLGPAQVASLTPDIIDRQFKVYAQSDIRVVRISGYAQPSDLEQDSNGMFTLGDRCGGGQVQPWGRAMGGAHLWGRCVVGSPC
jgi:hypothetical protein